MTLTVTVTPASIADLIEQRDELLEALKSILVGLIASREDIGVEDWIELAAAAIAKASPIAGLTEIGGEEVKNSAASQSEPVLTPKSAIGDAENGGPWKREGCTVYQLTQEGWGRGEPVMVNRWTAHVQGSRHCTEGELASIAQKMSAAPELLQALRGIIDELGYGFKTHQQLLDAIIAGDAAIARASGLIP